MTGTMKTDVHLLGVYGMRLLKGQKVRLLKASNLPYPLCQSFFAAPANGKWPDGVKRNDEDSILIDADEVKIVAA